MKKLIIINENDAREMSFEEVLECYQNLIRRTMKEFKNLKLEDEEKYQILSIQLWHCYKRYDSNTGVGFGHYAKKSLWGILGRQYRDSIAKKRTGLVVLSGDEIILNGDWDKVSRFERIEDNFNLESEIFAKVNYETFLESITQKQKEVIKMYEQGKRQVDIAEALGIRQGAVSRRIFFARNTFRECVGI